MKVKDKTEKAVEVTTGSKKVVLQILLVQVKAELMVVTHKRTKNNAQYKNSKVDHVCKKEEQLFSLEIEQLRNLFKIHKISNNKERQ